MIIGWGVLSLIGYLKKDGIYKNYSIDVKKTPYFVLVLDGIHDKIYPWSKELPDLLPDGTKPQNQESVIASTEMTDEENVAGQTETVMQDTETAAAKPKKFICQNCGKEFEALPFGNHNFCSNSCKSAYRRKNGIDNEIRICEICGKEFEINKYSKTRFCSKKCVGINRSRINEEKRKAGIPVIKTKNRSD